MATQRKNLVYQGWPYSSQATFDSISIPGVPKIMYRRSLFCTIINYSPISTNHLSFWSKKANLDVEIYCIKIDLIVLELQTILLWSYLKKVSIKANKNYNQISFHFCVGNENGMHYFIRHLTKPPMYTEWFESYRFPNIKTFLWLTRWGMKHKCRVYCIEVWLPTKSKFLKFV